MERNIILTLEEWDRVIEILSYSGHPDHPLLCAKMLHQLNDSQIFDLHSSTPPENIERVDTPHIHYFVKNKCAYIFCNKIEKEAIHV